MLSPAYHAKSVALDVVLPVKSIKVKRMQRSGTEAIST